MAKKGMSPARRKAISAGMKRSWKGLSPKERAARIRKQHAWRRKKR